MGLGLLFVFQGTDFSRVRDTMFWSALLTVLDVCRSLIPNDGTVHLVTLQFVH